MGVEGEVLGLAWQGVGTLAPRGGGQHGATKTPKEENAQEVSGLGAGTVGLAPVDFAMPGLIFFYFESVQLIHRSDLIWGSSRNRGSFCFFKGGHFFPSTPNACATDLLVIHHYFSAGFFIYQYFALIGKMLLEYPRWIVCVIASCVVPTF